ncbi:hypothetical protein PoB_003023700 [Plakobranchus ocellatus]|uniref:Secreted protein n=1 Tax=Plakobranchus ocellatus TaxID=259542 RepID=A0AAV4AA24_9GAST|nr:hypothetical protein PoB_003023700 [Plakobranchus ocellatus]
MLSPGHVNFSLLLCVHPAQKGLLGLLRPGESKGDEESSGKLPHIAISQEQSGPYSWFPHAWIKRRTHFTFYCWTCELLPPVLALRNGPSD